MNKSIKLSISPPRYQYPLESHRRENMEEDARCLALAEEAIEASGARGWPVTGVIVEPIQVCHMQSGESRNTLITFCSILYSVHTVQQTVYLRA